MPRSQLDRRTQDLKAAQVLAKNLDPIMAIVAQSLADVDPGQTALAPCARDARLVFDIANRLDAVIPLPEPVETWDVLIWALVAGIALAVYRRTPKSVNPSKLAAKLVTNVVEQATDRLALAHA
jgi:hypothetical protein